ncbi:MAG: tol-pal system YbgF family protein [Gemmatimonadales bacterium]
MIRRLFPIIAVTLAASCAYYNGLYNANRLARDANKAEREGRAGEARSFWNQVIVKTDSVLVRYPTSKHRDDALALQGHAYRKLGQCRRAFAPLLEVVDSSPDPNLVAASRLDLGQCYLDERQPDSAVIWLSPVVEVPVRYADDARYWRGRALLRMGALERALADLRRTSRPEAAFDRSLVFVQLGSAPDAAAELEAVLDERYQEQLWHDALAALGSLDERIAASLVDSLIERGDLTRGERARVLTADGLRQRSSGRVALALDRFAAAREVAPDSLAGRVAAAHFVLTEISAAREVAAVPDDLEAVATMLGPDQLMVAGAVDILTRLVADSVRHELSDLSRFVIAELVRDSLDAPLLASSLFQSIEVDFPGSVLVAKSLIAASVIDYDRGGILLQRVLERYPDSPYTLAMRGMATPRYEVIEDSLSVLLARQRPGEVVPVRGREADDEEIIN